MENIEKYLKGAALYGVGITGIFPTVDLYENRNLGAVISSLQSLGSEVSSLPLTCKSPPLNLHIHTICDSYDIGLSTVTSRWS